MTEQQPVATIRSIYEAFSRGDIPYILGQLDPGVDWRTPSTVPFSKGHYRGPDEVAQFFASIAQHVADPSVDTHEFVAAGDLVIVLLSFRRRGRETGTPFEAQEAHFWTLLGGKVVEHRAYADTAAIVQALKASPELIANA